jgi:purine-cytosine permease-like protein
VRERSTLCSAAIVLPNSFMFFFSAAILLAAGRPSSGIESTNNAGLLIGIHESVIAVAGQNPIEKV